jgi:protocatechuate 3,4-dioxygenase beta subunit
MRTRRMGRREALGVLGGAGAVLALDCGGDPAASDNVTSSSGTATSNGQCAVTPSEAAGPFPSLTDVFRSDIREGKPGSPLTLTIKVVNASDGCSPVAGADVEIWHVDATGQYSEYGAQSGQTFLRGIQTTGSSGKVVFTTIYPGWYQGRATHIHAEVKVGGASRKVTQIAFPESVNDAVHRSGVYASRGINPIVNMADGILADSLAAEIVTPSGDPASGYRATFQVGIAG